MAAWTYKLELLFVEWRIRRVIRSKQYEQAMQFRDWDTCNDMLDSLYARVLDIQRVQRLRESGL